MLLSYEFGCVCTVCCCVCAWLVCRKKLEVTQDLLKTINDVWSKEISALDLPEIAVEDQSIP